MDLVKLITILPQNYLSYLTGQLLDIKWPGPVQRFLNKAFVMLFKIDMSEAEKDTASYESITQLFTRRLKPGLRSAQKKIPFLSPCDGYLVRSEPLTSGQCLQVKGIYYDPEELILGFDEPVKKLGLSWYTTIYLAPHNYHRVHSPVTGQLLSITYLPGKLWPVNPRFTAVIPRLFCQNERLVFMIKSESCGIVYVVMVGAFNVGRMSTPYADVVTNQLTPGIRGSVKLHNTSIHLKQGDELGTFNLGSTVVMLFDPETVHHLGLRPCSEKDCQLGQELA